jgi:hypothetical protein
MGQRWMGGVQRLTSGIGKSLKMPLQVTSMGEGKERTLEMGWRDDRVR